MLISLLIIDQPEFDRIPQICLCCERQPDRKAGLFHLHYTSSLENSSDYKKYPTEKVEQSAKKLESVNALRM